MNRIDGVKANIHLVKLFEQEVCECEETRPSGPYSHINENLCVACMCLPADKINYTLDDLFNLMSHQGYYHWVLRKLTDGYQVIIIRVSGGVEETCYGERPIDAVIRAILRVEGVEIEEMVI